MASVTSPINPDKTVSLDATFASLIHRAAVVAPVPVSVEPTRSPNPNSFSSSSDSLSTIAAFLSIISRPFTSTPRSSKFWISLMSISMSMIAPAAMYSLQFGSTTPLGRWRRITFLSPTYTVCPAFGPPHLTQAVLLPLLSDSWTTFTAAFAFPSLPH